MSGFIKPPLGAKIKRDHPLALSIYAAWLFNEESGTTIHDAVGNPGNNLTLTNGPTWIYDAYGAAVKLDGTNDYVAGSGFVYPLAIHTGFTALIRIKVFTNENYAFIFNAGWNKFVMHSDSTGGIYCGIDTGYRFTPTDLPGVLTVGEWVHLAFSRQYKSGTGKFYKNGVLLSSKFMVNAPANFSSGLNISDPTTSQSIDAYVNEAYFFDRDLSDQEIAQLYADPYCIFENPPVLFVPSVGAPSDTPITPTIGSLGLSGVAARNNLGMSIPSMIRGNG